MKSPGLMGYASHKATYYRRHKGKAATMQLLRPAGALDAHD